MLNLDTHILIDLMIGHLSPKEDKLIRANEWMISDIVLWEIFKLNSLKRIEIDLESYDFQRLLSSLHVQTIDLNVIRALRLLDFHSDPADELIAATSVAFSVPLLTRDQKILKSKIVPFAI